MKDIEADNHNIDTALNLIKDINKDIEDTFKHLEDLYKDKDKLISYLKTFKVDSPLSTKRLNKIVYDR